MSGPWDLSRIRQPAGVAAGEGYSLALKSDGTAWAWGNYGFGQPGDDASAKLANGLMQAGRQGPMLAKLQVNALAALSDCAQTIFIYDKWLLTAGIARALPLTQHRDSGVL